MSRGLFIVLEGPDRAGKSTQCAKLAERLHDVVSLRFPDRTTIVGKTIDQYLKSDITLPAQSVHLLFSANRWEWSEKIKSILLAGKNVVCDRYAFSGVAYSVGAEGLQADWCRGPDSGLVAPDLVILLLPRQENVNLIEARGTDRERYDGQDTQMKVRHEFEALGKQLQSKCRWENIDADRTIEDVHNSIMLAVEEVRKQVTPGFVALWG